MRSGRRARRTHLITSHVGLTPVKVHAACGVKTNVITAVRILDKDAGDSPQFIPLVKDTARSFAIGEVSADKAYASLENFEAVAEMGGTAFIAFKKNATGGVGGEDVSTTSNTGVKSSWATTTSGRTWNPPSLR